MFGSDLCQATNSTVMRKVCQLRIRLCTEQIRLLQWAKEIGLLEEVLVEPSSSLRLNRIVIIDILLEIRVLSKE